MVFLPGWTVSRFCVKADFAQVGCKNKFIFRIRVLPYGDQVTLYKPEIVV